MTQMSYAEMLRRPEWQKMRLRVMERAEFRCEHCGDSETTLNVHHTYYTKGAKPWEYPDASLKCLCENCHEEWHIASGLLRAMCGQLDSNDLHYVLGFAAAQYLRNGLGDRTILLEDGPNARMQACGMAVAFDLLWRDDAGEFFDSADAILRARDDRGLLTLRSVDCEAREDLRAQSQERAKGREVTQGVI